MSDAAARARSRLATDDEVAAWRDHGWVLLDALVGADEIDAAAAELADLFPTAERYHADPDGERTRWLGTPPPSREPFSWPPDGPGFRPEQHRWRATFPFPGPRLNRLCVHPAIVDFVGRALGTTDLRLYQAGSAAKYTGETNYEQPMHTDRNHSWLPPVAGTRWQHVEMFLYLCDVGPGLAPTHLVSRRDSGGRSPTAALFMPDDDPDLYAAERAAIGPRGSLLAYRNDVFHRGVDLTEPGGARFFLNVSYKPAGLDWIGFDAPQARANQLAWDRFVEASTPRELELLGFPPPGHPVWDAEVLRTTALRYPKLDLTPWRDALAGESG